MAAIDLISNELIIKHHVRLACSDPALHEWVRKLALSAHGTCFCDDVILKNEDGVMASIRDQLPDEGWLEVSIFFNQAEGTAAVTKVITEWWRDTQKYLSVEGRARIRMSVYSTSFFEDMNLATINPSEAGDVLGVL